MNTCARPASLPASRLVADAVRDLAPRFPDVPPAEVTAVVADVAARVGAAARYDAYLPILVARRAAERLRTVP